MANYNGINMFGVGVKMSTTDNNRSQQINAFFGVSGLEVLDGGFRGRYTEVSGVLYGPSATSLAAAESQFRSFNDGVARTLVDNFGVTWSNVRLESFRPLGRVKQSPAGVFFRPYRARFLHLV